MANTTKATAEKIEEFLTVLGETANVSRAAEKIGISRQHMYRLRDEDLEFLARWNAAAERGLDALEDEVTRRGTEGWDEPVFHQGKECGKTHRYSDTLLMFRLNGGRPEKYRQRMSAELTGKGGGPITAVTIDTKDPIEAMRVYQQFMSGGK